MKIALLSLGLALAGASGAYAQAPAAAPPPPPPPLTADSKAPVVKAGEAMAVEVAFWTDATGKYNVARGAEAKNAPKNAAMAHVKFYQLGNGQNMREVTLPKGAPFTAPKGGDCLVFVTKGKLNVKLGTVSASLVAGDSYRKIGVQDNIYTCDDASCTIVETDAPPPKS